MGAIAPPRRGALPGSRYAGRSGFEERVLDVGEDELLVLLLVVQAEVDG